MNQEHSQHCHCNCNDLFDLQEAIEAALLLHNRHEPRTVDCLVCGSKSENCANCKWLRDCVTCAETWPCDTFLALDIKND